ncbi:MAG: DUF362 domain-containing protein [Desulfobacterales bacterium]|nr:DUF362 domain-containing protein [Desulfobacterales bacterium]
MNDTNITRRQCLGKIVSISATIAFSKTFSFAEIPTNPIEKPKGQPLFLIEGVSTKPTYSIRELVRQVFNAAGGIQKFISKADIVAIKPNISWARAPEYAATTHPEVLEAVIELCQEAGAAKIKIADNTIHDARQCFGITGVGNVAQKTGVELVFPRESLMKEMKINGDRLDIWPVFIPLIEADKLINLPVAKVHGLSTLTLGMKNWIGAVGGRRSSLHQDIHKTIVDLAQFFKPSLTLIDATRIMIQNGPSGGSLSDVQLKQHIILSNDSVAADAKGAELFGHTPDEIEYIRIAHQHGLGIFVNQGVTYQKVTI